MKRFAIGAAVCGLILVPTACSKTDNAPSSSDAAEDPNASLTIGWASNSETTPFTVAVTRGAKEEAEKLGVELVVTDAQFKTDKQQSDVQDLIAQQVDGLILLPVDGIAAQSLVDQAARSNIPVVATQSQVGDPATRPLKEVYPELVALVTQDEEAAGEQAGELVKEVLPESGDIAVILGAPGYAENELRTTEFERVLSESSAEYDIVAEQPGNWLADDAQTACANLLASNPDVKLFYSLYDDMSAGCANAIEAADSDAIIVSIGGNKSGIDPIKSGSSPIKATVCYQPETMGALAVKTMVDQLRGETDYEAEFVSYETFGVTKDNVDECPPQA